MMKMIRFAAPLICLAGWAAGSQAADPVKPSGTGKSPNTGKSSWGSNLPSPSTTSRGSLAPAARTSSWGSNSPSMNKVPATSKAPEIARLPSPALRPPTPPGLRPFVRPAPPRVEFNRVRPLPGPIVQPPPPPWGNPAAQRAFNNMKSLLNKTQQRQNYLPPPLHIWDPMNLERRYPEFRAPQSGDPRRPAVPLGPHPLWHDYDRYLQDGRTILVPRE